MYNIYICKHIYNQDRIIYYKYILYFRTYIYIYIYTLRISSDTFT